MPARHGLTLPLTSLIGREDDLAVAVDLVSGSRVLTVTGPGGVGKTRFALAAASEVAATFADGVWFCDLAEVEDGSGLWASVAAGLRLEPDGDGDLPEQVIARLRSGELLLILDSCEQQASECAALVRAVAPACPGVSFLVTSRQPAGIEGERLWRLAGLGSDAPSGGHRPPPAVSPAVHLFVERAQAQKADFALGPEEVLVVAEVCRRLDGLPLAIELAAAHVGVLTPAEILARLDDPLLLLVGGSTATPARHRSLAASLEWDHRLLSGDEAVLFSRLSVFAGGFTLAAVEAVCASPPLGDGNLLEVLASLIAKSLVVAEAAGDKTRYRLLDTTRAFAARRLAASRESECLRERHAMWVMALAKEAEPEVRGSKPEAWLARLAADHDNVNAALDWTVLAGRTDWTLGIAAAMAAFWRKSGLIRTGAEWLSKALALPQQQQAGLRVEALLGQAHILGEGGDPAGAVGPLEEALQLAQERGDMGAEARALNLLGRYRLFLDVPTTALAPLERSSEKARAVGDHRTVLLSLSSAGWVAMVDGDARVAEARFRECLDAAAQGDEPARGETWAAVVGMGCAALRQGRHREAENSLAQALATAERMSLHEPRAAVWCHLGQLARARGDYGRASALLGQSLSVAREETNSFTAAVRLALLGSVAHDQGDLDGAEAALVEAMSVSAAGEFPFARAHCLVGLGSLRVTQGKDQDAADILHDAEALAGTYGFSGIISAVLLEHARLRRRGGDLQHAARALTRAIELQDRLGDLVGLVDSLEALGGVRASQGRSRIACRLLASASAARRDGGTFRPPVRVAGFEADVDQARSGLTPTEWDAMWAAGETLSPAGAAALAVRSPGRRDSSRTGWAAITPTEREVIALVAQGLTNREAAAKLVISSRTVEAHVAHILAKLEIPSRRQLAREASAKGFG